VPEAVDFEAVYDNALFAASAAVVLERSIGKCVVNSAAGALRATAAAAWATADRW
jgi:hypothetical protein